MNSPYHRQNPIWRKLRIQSLICAGLYALVLLIQAFKFPTTVQWMQELSEQITRPFSVSQAAQRVWQQTIRVHGRLLAIADALIPTGTEEWGFLYPTQNQVRAGYLEKHPATGQVLKGLLFESEQGEPVVATETGVVVEISSNQAMGRYLVIKHRGEMLSVYKHLDEIRADLNEKVEKGQEIGTATETLLFEIWVGKEPADPDLYLSPGGI